MVSKFMASQDTRLSKFEADFKQQQGEMTNKIDTVLKDITDRIAGTLPSDMIKNPKLGTHLVLSARSYPTMDPQCSTQIHSSINAIMIHPKQQTDSHDDKTKENEEEERDSPESHSDSSTNFTGRIEGMHVFVGDFTYVVDFMIVEGISSIIDLRLSHVVLRKPFIEVSNMTHDLPEGIVRSLEVLRKFYWMILEGRFNQLSHVYSPLFSKPMEY
nr:MAK10-like protein [Tanacetum cinerariifolium]